MNVVKTVLPGVVIVEPKVFGDARGFFLESYRKERYVAAGIDAEFVQDNHSRSRQGVLRGLHLQGRRPQAKLVRVLAGRIWDVVVDVDPASPTFRQHVAAELSDENHRQMFVPRGYAHGLCVLSETADVEYKVDDYYDPDGELSIRWDDPELAIPWPVAAPLLSAKDQGAMTLADFLQQRRA